MSEQELQKEKSKQMTIVLSDAKMMRKYLKMGAADCN
jgi:hypothetical protein